MVIFYGKCRGGIILKAILIVDDDIHIGNLLEELLNREGYLVFRA